MECGASGPDANSSLLMAGVTLEGQEVGQTSPAPGECSWCGRGRGERSEGMQLAKGYCTPSPLYPTEYPVSADP